jgi:hypothetical protein
MAGSLKIQEGVRPYFFTPEQGRRGCARSALRSNTTREIALREAKRYQMVKSYVF